MKSILSKVFTLLLVVLLSISSLAILDVKAQTRTVTVPDEYPTIQEAINNSNDGDTIYVKHGTYQGNIVISKSLSLIGENKHTTIIQGNQTLTTLIIQQNNVQLTGFTIQNPTNQLLWDRKRGIHLLNANNCTISENIILENPYKEAIWLFESHNNNISKNTIDNADTGIRIQTSSKNKIYKNTISNTQHGLSIEESNECTTTANILKDNTDGITIDNSHRNTFIANNISSFSYGVRFGILGNLNYHTQLGNNSFCHNNFINNAIPVGSTIAVTGNNSFDNGYQGNYWSTYKGEDLDGDGIGDTPFTVFENHQDNYPLMELFSYIEPTPTPTTTPTSSIDPEPFRFSSPNLIIAATITLLIGLGILSYFKKYRGKNLK